MSNETDILKDILAEMVKMNKKLDLLIEETSFPRKVAERQQKMMASMGDNLPKF